MSDPRDAAIRFKHEVEQHQEMMHEVAHLLASYYKQLVTDGMPEEVAQACVVDYQRMLFEREHHGQQEE